MTWILSTIRSKLCFWPFKAGCLKHYWWTKKQKMHSQLATGTMIPAKPSKPTKLVSMQHALTKQKQQHILIVPVQRKVRNVSLSKQKHAKGSFWGVGDWRNKWHSYCTSMGSDAPALLRKVKLKIAPQELPFVISCKYSHSYKVHKVSQDHPCGFGDVNPERCLPLQVVYSHHLFSHLPPCHTVSRNQISNLLTNVSWTQSKPRYGRFSG